MSLNRRGFLGMGAAAAASLAAATEAFDMWDDQEAYFRGLLGWVRDVEAGSTAKKKA